MEKVLFGKTGLHVSRLGFGSAPIGYLKTDQEEAGRLMNLLLDNGVNLIDTAASYPGSEEAIGKTIGHRRDEFVLVSKCGSKIAGLEGAPWSEQLITQTVDRSLKNLGTDHLDVMLLHSCDMAKLQAGEAMGALVKARDAGKIRFAGYSGDNEAAAFAATLPHIAVVQTSVSIADQANVRDLLPVTRQHGQGVMAKRPIANAAWKDLSTQRGLYQSYAKTYHDRLKTMAIDPGTLGFSGTAAEAWLEMAFRFTLSIDGVHTAIIGTTNADNALANLRLVERGPLSQDVVEKLQAAFAAADPERKWVGQT